MNMSRWCRNIIVATFSIFECLCFCIVGIRMRNKPSSLGAVEIEIQIINYENMDVEL